MGDAHKQVVYTGPWVDAQEASRRYPETYEAPTGVELAALAVGAHIRLNNGEERFWVILTEVGAPTSEEDPYTRTYRGTICNRLVGDVGDYDYGDTVEFAGSSIHTISA